MVDAGVVRRDGDLLAEEHDGEAAAAVEDVLAAAGDRAADEAVDEPLVAEPVEGGVLAGQVAERLDDEHRKAAALGGLHDEAGELGEVGHVELRHGEPDHAGPAAAQVLRGAVGLVAQLLDGGEDLLADAVADVRVVADDVGHRLARHAGAARHVLLRHGQRGHPHLLEKAAESDCSCSHCTGSLPRGKTFSATW
ncbi:hypothetical protein GCM10027610_054710 [Dactylosporangium cerinum]